jgi:hypothetical protein
MIEKNRGSPVLLRFFKKVFRGVLITDFWGAYNAIICAKQKCLVHLFRELKAVEKYKDKSGDWRLFSKQLKRIFRDAMRLCGRRPNMEPAKYERLRGCIEHRLSQFLELTWTNTESQRLIKRLKRHRNELLTFLYYNIPFDNNHAERQVRSGVEKRKNSYCNRSEKGAETQAILMSIFHTLKQRGYNAVNVIGNALREAILTKKLQNLPKK